MLEDASQIETTETPAEAPASQPDQGGDTPATTQVTEQVSAPQGQSVQQQPPMIPKYRFDEVNHRAQAAEARLRELTATPPQPVQAPQAPKQDDFQTYEEYVRADARYVAQQEVRQTLAQERQQQQQAAQQQAIQNRAQTVETNWAAKSQEAYAKYPDFEQKISTSAPLTNAFAAEVMKASPMAGDLAYHLASNPDIIGRLNGMHPLDAAAELGRIEGRLQGSSGQPPQRKPSAGIPALNPVKGGTQPGHKKTDDLSPSDVVARLYPTY